MKESGCYKYDLIFLVGSYILNVQFCLNFHSFMHILRLNFPLGPLAQNQFWDPAACDLLGSVDRVLARLGLGPNLMVQVHLS